MLRPTCAPSTSESCRVGSHSHFTRAATSSIKLRAFGVVGVHHLRAQMVFRADLAADFIYRVL